MRLAHISEFRARSESEAPLYKQLASHIRSLMTGGELREGERLPATRELAGLLGLNRTTVSAAYALLEEDGLLAGHVGRGSFVARPPKQSNAGETDWERILPPAETGFGAPPGEIAVSFATSRPPADAFPLTQFRRLAKQVIDGPDAAGILQLGSPHGYGPLRRYLLERATSQGVARDGDDILITNGCQQALDLAARLLAGEGTSVLLEDPVYPGVQKVFSRAGGESIPLRMDGDGIRIDELEAAIQQERPRLLVLTPSFQNPTGATLSLARRKAVVALAQRHGLIVVENDIYSELRYAGEALPPIKQLDGTGNTILLGSYSKVSFPGLRVGWVIGPRAVIARLAEAKQATDLHSDQLSQAVLLRFAESGELERHIERTRRAGAERLTAVLDACRRFLPKGTAFTRPEGGMSLWVELPAPVTAEHLLSRVRDKGVDFLPGRYFSSGREHLRGLRISFGGLSPADITSGLQIIGEAATKEMPAIPNKTVYDAVPALV